MAQKAECLNLKCSELWVQASSLLAGELKIGYRNQVKAKCFKSVKVTRHYPKHWSESWQNIVKFFEA
jgi:hypothetical protein